MAKRFGQSNRAALRFADLGCGQGASSWFLAREGFTAVPVDGSFSALKKARLRMDKEGLEFEGAVCCLTKLPFANAVFDAAVDVVSIAHNTLGDMRKIFDEVARTLKPKGLLFSVLPTVNCSRHTFRGTGDVTFLERLEIDYVLGPKFQHVDVLLSSYELSHDCCIRNWIVTADRK